MKILHYDDDDDDKNFNLIEKSYRVCSDWVLSIKYINNENIAAVLMHNKVQIWNYCLEVERESICEEKCILYSAYIHNNAVPNLIVFSGTVFCEILIWKLGKEEESCVLRRLQGHKVSTYV